MYPTEAVRQFLEKEKLSHVSVTCALSGGADSVCLLICLLYWQKQYALHISALHVQHNLRGEESQRDEQFCRQLCETLHVDLQVISVDVQKYRKQHTCSVETAARECRYRAFAEHAGGLVATAHTASDNLETVLFRLARGTGMKGLCGIPPRREQYIRPLLFVSRQEIEVFLAEQAISYITDSSNLQDDYSRNFIRHHLVPLMEQVHTGAEQSVSRMTEILRQEEDFLADTARHVFQEHRQPDGSLQNLHILHPALQRRCIALFLEENHLRSDYASVLSVQKLLEQGGQTELIRGELSAHVSQHVLSLQKKICSVPEAELVLGKNQIFPEYLVTAERIEKKNPDEFKKIYTKFANSALDYDIIKKSVILHGRKNGMYFKPSGRTHTVRIKKWLQTQPVSVRSTLHYLSDEAGLLWVQNLGVADRAAVTEHTENMLILHVHQSDTESTLDYHVAELY